MKKCLYILLSAAITLVSLGSCIRQDAVKVQSISDVNVSLKGTPSVDFVLTAENTSGRNITVSNAVLELSDDHNCLIARIKVGNDILLTKRSVSKVVVPLKISIDNPFAGFALLSDLENNMKSLYVSGSVKVKAGCLSKNIKIDRMLLTDFINRFGGRKAFEQYYKAA